MLPSCDRAFTRGYLEDYLADRLTIDAKLDFLFHVEDCAGCWEEVFAAAKVRDAHLYRNGNKQPVSSDCAVPGRGARRREAPAEVEEVNAA